MTEYCPITIGFPPVKQREVQAEYGGSAISNNAKELSHTQSPDAFNSREKCGLANRSFSTSVVVFIQQSGPLPRSPCLICSLVSMAAAAKPATHRSHWDFPAIEL